LKKGDFSCCENKKGVGTLTSRSLKYEFAILKRIFPGSCLCNRTAGGDRHFDEYLFSDNLIFFSFSILANPPEAVPEKGCLPFDPLFTSFKHSCPAEGKAYLIT